MYMQYFFCIRFDSTVEFVIVFGEAQVIQFALLALIISSRLSKPEHGCMHGWPVDCLALAREESSLA